MAESISFDSQQKIWKSGNYPYEQFINQTIGEAFLKNALCTDSSKVLESYHDSDVQKSMGEILRESITAAVHLQEMAIKRGDVLVFFSMVNPKVSPITMGALLLGVSVNFFETKFDKEQIEHTLQLASPTILLYEDLYKTMVQSAVECVKLPNLRYMFSIDGTGDQTVDRKLLRPIPQTEIDNFVPPKFDDPQKLVAVLLLTSGSTGLPKVVAISHSLMLHGMRTFWSDRDDKMQLTPDSVVFSFSPLRWCTQIDLMLEALLLGVGRVCANNYPSGLYGREIVRKGRITHFFSVPTTFHDILLATEESDKDALSSLRGIMLGGETPSQSLIDLARTMAPQAKIFRGYGMTEVAGVIGLDQHLNGGHIVTGLELKILDDNLKSVGHNTSGQLCIRSPVPYLGYLKIDNRSSFYEDGFFNTGDYGFVDTNNALHFLARYKDLVRVKDIILIPTDIGAIVSSHPDVSASHLVGYRRSPKDNDDTGAIFLVLKDSAKCTNGSIKTDIRNLLKSKLRAEEFNIIKDIHILDKFPLTSCGKVDKVALARIAREAA